MDKNELACTLVVIFVFVILSYLGFFDKFFEMFKML
jgi:hypothetical protein